MAELQQLGALDPAAREKLMADMHQTDPAFWPGMLRAFRGSAEYRRRAGQEKVAATGGVRPPSEGAIAQSTKRPTVSPPSADPLADAAQPSGTSTGLPTTAAALAPLDPLVAGHPPGNRNAVAVPSRVVAASYETGAAPDWQAPLAGAIEILQSEVKRLESELQQLKSAPGSSRDAARKARETLTAKQAQLRLLSLLAGRREDAMRPISQIDPAVQEFWTAQCCSLDTLIDVRRNPDAMVRARQAKRLLSDAVARLGETAPLVVRNLAFCSEIKSYGRTKQYPTKEFIPGERLLLYAEVENFTSQSTPKGYHTSLRSSYQIFDSRNQRVADYQFTTTEEYCQQPRRDYFIGYHLRLPERIYPGKHTLQLTVEDLKSQKVGQSSIELTIKNAAD